ncbi:helix-turn-helix domain-containing protein [Kitasatospora sp. NPDC085879]|uniref:PucR family transcriptional regulator n=1 Tax=Kitasatospora sp. NPDC085879 TaxID=3154769 RepID=UPI003417B218
MSRPPAPGRLTVAELVRLGPLGRARSCGAQNLDRKVCGVALISSLDGTSRSAPGTALVLHPAAAAGYGVWALESALRLAWECNASCIAAPDGTTVTGPTTRLAERLHMPLFIVEDPCDLALKLAATIADTDAARARLTARCAALFGELGKARDILGVINSEVPGVSAALLSGDGRLLAGRAVAARADDRVHRLQVAVPGPDGRPWATLVAHLPAEFCAWRETVETILRLARAPLALSVAQTRLTTAHRAARDRLLLETLLDGRTTHAGRPGRIRDGGHGPASEPEHLAREAGWRIDGRHTAVYLQSPQGTSQLSEATTYVIDLWQESFPGLPVVPTSRGWVTWFTGEDGEPRDVAERVRRTLSAQRIPIPLAAGVGRPGGGVAGLRRSVTEADLAAAVAVRRHGGAVERYSDLGLQVVLACLPVEEIATAARVLLSDLAADPKADVLIGTLSALLDCAGSTGQAAARLGVHRNTMLGRLERIRSCGVDLDSPDQRLALHVACYALSSGATGAPA